MGLHAHETRSIIIFMRESAAACQFTRLCEIRLWYIIPPTSFRLSTLKLASPRAFVYASARGRFYRAVFPHAATPMCPYKVGPTPMLPIFL